MSEDEKRWRSVRVGSGLSRRDIMRQLGGATAIGSAAGLAGCTGLIFEEDDDPNDEAPENGNNNNGNGDGGPVPDYQLIELIPPPTELNYEDMWGERDVMMVTHDAATSFFDPCIAGLHDACYQLGWTGEFTGPTGGHDVEEQISIMESIVDAGPDVLITTLTDSQAYDAVIEEAIAADITVLVYNTIALDAEEMRDKYGRSLSYTGQENIAAGYVCGLAAAERLDDDEGLVTIGTCCPGHSALEDRAEGIERALLNETNVDVNVLEYTDDPSEGVTRLEDHITAEDDLIGIVGTDAYTWTIGEALESQGVEDEILGGGFDLEEPTLNMINDGIMDYTIGQDPYSQGYMPVMLSWLYLERGIPPKDYRTGAEIIDQENVEFTFVRDDFTTLMNWQDQTY